jgi:hypothetical protein
VSQMCHAPGSMCAGAGWRQPRGSKKGVRLRRVNNDDQLHLFLSGDVRQGPAVRRPRRISRDTPASLAFRSTCHFRARSPELVRVLELVEGTEGHFQKTYSVCDALQGQALGQLHWGRWIDPHRRDQGARKLLNSALQARGIGDTASGATSHAEAHLLSQRSWR